MTELTDAECDALIRQAFPLTKASAAYRKLVRLAARSADTSGALHVAVCQAVALLNRAPEVARCTEGREARDILRQALVEYADTYMDQPAPETERAAVARKHQKSTRRTPPAAPGGPARRPDENSPSGPSDRALNPQPEAVDRDRGAL